MIRIGLIGCGLIGRAHSRCIKALAEAGLADARVTAVLDADLERATEMAGHHGAVVGDDIGSLLDGVDVAWICTWTNGHLPAIREAVARGVAVFCEKPLAPTLADCVEAATLLRSVPHQVGLVLRYAPVFANAAEAITSGRCGPVLAATLRDDQYFPIQGLYGSTWRSDAAAAGGGTLIEHSIHDVDVLRMLLGDPSHVSGRVASRFGYEGIDDVAVAGLHYSDGAQATLTSIWHQILTRGSSRRLEVFCERAYMWTESDYLGPLHVETSDGSEVVDGEPPAWTRDLALPQVLRGSMALYAAQAKAFLDAIAAGTRPAPTADDALASHRIVDAVYRSSVAGGAPVQLQEG